MRRYVKRDCAAAVAALAVLLALAGCADNAETPSVEASQPGPETFASVSERAFEPPPEPEPEPEPSEPEPYQPALGDIASLPGQKEPFAFASAEGDEAPTLSEESAAAISDAVGAFEQHEWDVGYLLFDLETGRGVAGNVDTRVFVASSIKGPFAQFICETQLDTGKAKAEDKVDGDATVGSLMEAAVSESDNDAYNALRNRFAGQGFDAWLDGLGIGDGFSRELPTPSYTARESAQLWLHMHEYLNSDAPSASRMGGLLENTRVSFMRHALAYGDVSVISKAGWYDGEDDEDGFCDSGIVTEDGHAYVLTVMTSAPYSAGIEYDFESIMQAVWNARGELAE